MAADDTSEAPLTFTESGASGCSRRTENGRCNAPLDRKNVRYCKAHRDEMAADYRARTRPRPTSEERICGWCDNTFIWRSTHPKQDCCSKSCYMKRRHREEHPVDLAALSGGLKHCSGCDQVRLREDYSPSQWERGGRCRECMREYDKRWASDNKDKTSAAARRSRARRLLIRYQASSDDVDVLLAGQGGACYLCNGDAGDKGFHIDHDHELYEQGLPSYRGLACHGCNVGIGAMGDDPARMRRIAGRLEERKAELRARA